MMREVLVIEIKKDYALALTKENEVIKIKLKEGLEVGQTIYVLSEDVIMNKKVNKKNMLFKGLVAGISCCLIIVAVMSMRQMPAYALVSVDGKDHLQLVVDKNYKITNAISLDGSYSKEHLDKLKGQSLSNLAYVEDDLVVGYALYDEDDQDEALTTYLKETFGSDAYYAKGSASDIQVSEKDQISLGLYLIEQALNDEDKLEDILESKSLEELVAILKENPELLNNEEVIDELEDKLESDDDLDEDDDLDDDDDDLDDDD